MLGKNYTEVGSAKGEHLCGVQISIPRMPNGEKLIHYDRNPGLRSKLHISLDQDAEGLPHSVREQQIMENKHTQVIP